MTSTCVFFTLIFCVTTYFFSTSSYAKVLQTGGLNLHCSRGYIYAIMWQYKLVSLQNDKRHSKIRKTAYLG